MKNKSKNNCIAFRSLVYLLSFFIQNCTNSVEKHKSAEQEDYKECSLAFLETSLDKITAPAQIILNPVSTVENIVNAIKNIPNLPEIIEQKVLEFSNLSEEEQCLAIAKGFGSALGGRCGVVPSKIVSKNLGLAVKEVGKVGEIAKKFVVEKVGNIYKAPEALKAFPKTRLANSKTPLQGGGGLRKRWKDDKGKIYEWDSRHGRIEVYTKNGKSHLGEYDPITGTKLSEGKPGRSVSP